MNLSTRYLPQAFSYSLLRLLCGLFCRRTIQPDCNKSQPAQNGNPDTTNPYPRTADLPTPWPFVVRKVSDGDLPLFIDGGDEGAAVIDAEVENTMLVRSLEGDTKDGCVRGFRSRSEIEAVEWREHAELKLNLIVGGENEWGEMVVGVLGDFHLEMLLLCQYAVL